MFATRLPIAIITIFVPLVMTVYSFLAWQPDWRSISRMGVEQQFQTDPQNWRARKIKDIAVAVVTNGHRQNQTVPAILDTWGQDFERIEIFSATSGPLVTRVVPTDTRKARSSWEEMNALKILHDLYPDSPWYFKADDDTYVNAIGLAEVASRHSSSEDAYVGLRLWITQTNRSDSSSYQEAYCAGGCGYLVSNSLMKKIAHSLLLPVEEWNSCCSDVQIGVLINSANASAQCKHDEAFYGKSIFPILPSSPGELAFSQGIPYTKSGSSALHRLFHVAAIHDTPPAFQYIFRTMFLGFETEFTHNDRKVDLKDLKDAPSFFISSKDSRDKADRVVGFLEQSTDGEAKLTSQAIQNSACNCSSQQPQPESGSGGNLKRGSLAARDFNFNGVCGENGFKCVIAFTLFGDNKRYTVGAIQNSILIKHVFPGWTARFYCEQSTVPSNVIQELLALGSEVVALGPIDTAGYAGTRFSRFMIADDPSVDRYLVRDADSRLNSREKAAVDEWIASGFSVHTMRDHPAHARPMNGGMWGAVRGAIPNMSAIAKMVPKDGHSDDQTFLGNYIYPMVEQDQLGHDSVTCRAFLNSRSFPTRRAGNEHVGAVISTDTEELRGIDAKVLENFVADLACRRHPDWTKG